MFGHIKAEPLQTEEAKCQIRVKSFQLLIGWINPLPGSRSFLVWFGVFGPSEVILERSGDAQKHIHQ